ncbi:MAG: 4-diphosphocytidyl-2C-methyl-D-erythritol kinase [Synergistaceae bacterium]|nr:4-diphosphocytidyl-2C-methyl-D-erythritol kinase [Synergistaceae bacterium]
MRYVQPSAAKVNLSLRVTGRREDGYHDIVSLFLRLPSAETLLISETEGADEVRVSGAEIQGENIVSRALRAARETGFDIRPLGVEIVKTLYPGSGLGGGSGNGAALLRWLAGPDDGPEWRAAARKTGADVPFLFSGCPLALVSGTGDIVEPLESLAANLLVAFPDWNVNTENAYEQLDRRGESHRLPDPAARAEALRLSERLRGGEKAGFLPNDFAPFLMEKFPGYARLFDVFDDGGAFAWGITGSGGAAFALFREFPRARAFHWPPWVRQILSESVR